MRRGAGGVGDFESPDPQSGARGAERAGVSGGLAGLGMQRQAGITDLAQVRQARQASIAPARAPCSRWAEPGGCARRS